MSRLSEPLFTEVLPAVARGLHERAGVEAGSPDDLYNRTVETVVRILLEPACPGDREEPYDENGSPDAATTEFVRSRLGAVAPREIGSLYERMRGFLIDPAHRGDFSLIPSSRSKRNQGLFYTPPAVVRRITASALDGLDPRGVEDVLRLRIVDPAAGTGAFLVEALNRLTALWEAAPAAAVDRRLEEVRERLQTHARSTGVEHEPDRRTLIRVRILEDCLYGVELDPIAATIARAILRREALGQFTTIDGIRTNLKIGNALIGSADFQGGGLSRQKANARQMRLFHGNKKLTDDEILAWAHRKPVFNWPLEFPEAFAGDRPGFAAVIGNPPYEILSVKESGIDERKGEQRYYRAAYTSCLGKINLYRLMMERGFRLLQTGGVLSFIVPAGLLADATAGRLRRMFLDESEILETLVIPEKARVFEGVTQALLVFTARKRGATASVTPVPWDGRDQPEIEHAVEVPRELIESLDGRIPVLRDEAEKRLLEALSAFPRFGGENGVPAAGRVHQGEVNLTVHRRFITHLRTAYPLIRGEHVKPFRADHPCRNRERLDWVTPEFLESRRTDRGTGRRGLRVDGRPWERSRIVLGRVVNMAADRRLKAAEAPAGSFLGDMTNFIADATLPHEYLLALLNSRLLNWRFKAVSANNYISAAEILGLPIPRPDGRGMDGAADERAWKVISTDEDVLSDDAPVDAVRLKAMLGRESSDNWRGLLPGLLCRTSAGLSVGGNERESVRSRWFAVLDALVALLFRVESLTVPPAGLGRQ